MNEERKEEGRNEQQVTNRDRNKLRKGETGKEKEKGRKPQETEKISQKKKQQEERKERKKKTTRNRFQGHYSNCTSALTDK